MCYLLLDACWDKIISYLDDSSLYTLIYSNIFFNKVVGRRLTKEHRSFKHNQLINMATRDGNLEILQWSRENGCFWNRRTCGYAARNGHLKVLKWAIENGCRWNKMTCALAARGVI